MHFAISESRVFDDCLCPVVEFDDDVTSLAASFCARLKLPVVAAVSVSAEMASSDFVTKSSSESSVDIEARDSLGLATNIDSKLQSGGRKSKVGEGKKAKAKLDTRLALRNLRSQTANRKLEMRRISAAKVINCR